MKEEGMGLMMTVYDLQRKGRTIMAQLKRYACKRRLMILYTFNNGSQLLARAGASIVTCSNGSQWLIFPL